MKKTCANSLAWPNGLENIRAMIPCHALAARTQRFGIVASILLLAVAVLSGCATAPATFKAHPAAAERLAAGGRVTVAPIDAELAELTAGGLLEPREEWTATARRNLLAAIAAEAGYQEAALANAPAETAAELEEVQALVRAFTVHRMSAAITGGNDPFAETNQSLTYNTGPVPQLAGAANADAILFIFIRDSFASAGRKSLVALSVVGAALTGVAIVPRMGSTSMSAALVDRDGTVLWFNHSLGGHDPRTPEGARALVRDLLKGLPGRPPAT